MLAMVYRKNVGFHLRLMTGTGLALLGPGLGRFLFNTLGLPGPVGGLVMMICTTMVPLIWLIMDIKNRKSAFPLGFYVSISVFMLVMGMGNYSAWWQAFAGWWVKTFY